MRLVKQIVCTLALSLCFSSQVAAQNVSKVQGTVVSSDGEPLPGASVRVEGTSQGVLTDIDGRFNMSDLKPGTKLTISYIGMKSKTVVAKAGLKIVLEDQQTAMDEIVVTAFGEQKRSAFTGSAAVVDSKKLEQKQLTNVIGALQGEAAGVQMINNSGDPTGTPEIRIRGFSSINAGNDPLIIVDGSPYDGGWNNLNPADVASVTVLKDAASAALYGARGANGIIMITTKRAQMGTAAITFDAKWGATSRIQRDYETIDNVGQYYETYYKALYNYYKNSKGYSDYEAYYEANSSLGLDASSGGLGYLSMSVPEGENFIGDNGRLNPHATLGNVITGADGKTQYTLMPDDWMKEASRTGLRQEYNLNANGGNEKAQYYASLGYLNTQGISYNSDFERINARLKANYQANNWLRLGGNANFAHSKSNYTSSSSNNIFYVCNSIAPIYPVYLRDANGNIMTDGNGKMYDYGDAAVNGLNRPYQTQYNPLQDVQLNTYDNSENMFMLNGFVDITPLEGLKITLNGSVTGEDRRNTTTVNPFYGWSAVTYPTGYISRGSDRTVSTNFQQLINYHRNFGKHYMELLAGHENYKMNYDNLWASRTGMADYLGNQTLMGAITLDDNGGNQQDYNTEGWFFRAQYDYDQKYFASASVRADASSRFHPDHRWGAFYSFGGAWMLTKEAWLNDVSWLNTLKLKASFGQVGNDKIGDFRYMDTYKLVNSDGHVGLQLSSIGNPEITWETVSSWNFGLEFELFKSRISGGIDFFHRTTKDMLCFVRVPNSAGYSGSYNNVGDMMNRGVELDFRFGVIRTKALQWDITANATLYKNEIKKIDSRLKGSPVEGVEGYINGEYYYGEGRPMYTWYLPKYAGVNSEGQSQWYVTNSDGTLDVTTSYGDADNYLCGDPNPWMYGGFGTSLSFKGFDFSVSFSYSLGGKAYDYGYASLMTCPVQGTTGYAIHKDVLNAWSTDNASSDIPRWQYQDQNSTGMSDRFLTDASWLTLQNINLGYSLPVNLVKRIGLSKLRLYVACENLYYWTARKGFDPRGSFSGSTSTATYSPSRTISGGVTVQF